MTRHAEANLASDRKRKQPRDERGDETDEQLRADPLFEFEEAMATLRVGEVQLWEGIARRLARVIAHQLIDTSDAERCRPREVQLAMPNRGKSTRALHTEVLHRAIAQFVAAAMDAITEGEAPAKDENGQSWRGRQDVIYNASKIFDVCERTVEEAVAQYPSEAFFTDGSKLRATAAD